MMNKRYTQGVLIFVIAFAVRVVAVTVTTVTDLNPDSQADAVKFGDTAALIARGLAKGAPYRYTESAIDLSELLFPMASVDVYTLWGTFLAPFWLLPGPSGFYARLGNAFLGTFAIYNVYLISRRFHSHHAGVVASLPLVLYPSVIAVQSTLLREAIILFGITTTVRFLLIPPERLSRLFSYILAGFFLHISLLQRSDNALIIGTAIAAALTAYAVESGYLSQRSIKIGVPLSSVAFFFALPLVRRGVNYLARIRELRTRGRAVYLPDAIPRTIVEFIAFSWVGAAYFLYAPFPWMVKTVPDLLVGIEGLINLVFTIAAIWGIRSMGKKNPPATIALFLGLTVAVIMYGVGTANYGTGIRHRQMFIWVIFLFGGIGISEYIRFEWPFQ